MWVFLSSAFVIAASITIACTPLTIKIARRFGLVDDPRKHVHPAVIHSHPVPRAGGVPIITGILVAMVVLLPKTPLYVSIMVAASIAALVGVLDDRYDLSPYVRFGANILCAVIVVMFGVSVPFITNPLGGILYFSDPFMTIAGLGISLSHIIAVIWIVWVMNMLNWSKGVDGQMPGIAAIAAFVIGLASLRFASVDSGNIESAGLAFMVAGSAFGFLLFNFYPAKIFPGYSATVLGFLIGVLSITSGVKLATAVLVMGVPFVDALFTIARRVLSRRSPFWHDKGHLHHLLLEYGLTARGIAIFYWGMSLLLGLVALSASSRGKLFAIILLLVLFSGLFFMLRIIVKKGQEYD